MPWHGGTGWNGVLGYMIYYNLYYELTSNSNSYYQKYKLIYVKESFTERYNHAALEPKITDIISLKKTVGIRTG